MSQRQKKPGVQDYDFYSFAPVFSFALGALIATFVVIASGADPVVVQVLWILCLVGTSWGVIHLFNTWRRRKTLDKRRQRAEEEERERRALLARQNAALANEEGSAAARRRRRRRSGA
jgi:hypothetical protein